jgi:hypothetical protein
VSDPDLDQQSIVVVVVVMCNSDKLMSASALTAANHSAAKPTKSHLATVVESEREDEGDGEGEDADEDENMERAKSVVLGMSLLVPAFIPHLTRTPPYNPLHRSSSQNSDSGIRIGQASSTV